MKRIMNGVTYNTDTATRVAGDGAANLLSMGGWDMYQTRHGAFFMVVTGPDGETTLIKPYTDADAQAFLERHANHVVDELFGPFREAGAAERRLTIRIPGNLADRVEAAAKARGLSLNSYAMRCFEQCATADGQPPGMT